MSALKALKGLFVQEDPNAAPAATPAPEAEETAAPVRGRAGSTSRTRSAEVEGEEVEGGDESIDKDIMANLEKALADNTPKTYGYQQFAATLEKMKKKTPSEAARFTAALAAAEAMGCNPARLIETANAAITVLKGEQTTFKSEMNALNKENEDKQAQLKEVEDQIKTLTSKQTKLNKELEASAANIQTTQMRFNTTFKSKVAEINADIEKISEYSSK